MLVHQRVVIYRISHYVTGFVRQGISQVDHVGNGGEDTKEASAMWDPQTL